MKNKHLEEHLPLKKNETGILIKLNRATGEFEFYVEGTRIEAPHLARLFLSIVKQYKEAISAQNGEIPSKPTSFDDDPGYN